MKLGIIGGGGAAVALLAALTRDRLPDLDVTVFEPAKNVGPGRAYLPDSDVALLNVSAERMSVLPDVPGHFLRWVQERGGLQGRPVSPTAFLPRRLFGEYLADVATGISDQLAGRGRRVRTVGSSVMRLREGPTGFHALTEDGRRFGDLDRVVLCVGTGGPVDVYRLARSPGYVNDPYPLNAQLAAVPPKAHVLVLGTGLTAVDTVLFLLENGHRGRVTMASRNGLLPTVRTVATAPELRHLSRTAVLVALTADPVMTGERLLALLDRELQEAGTSLDRACAEAAPGESAARRLRRQLGQARDGGALWQPVIIEAMHEAVELIWHAMPDAERRRFLTRWHRKFITLLSPMPQESAIRLQAAAEAGRLRVVHGVRGIRPVERLIERPAEKPGERPGEMPRPAFLASTAVGEIEADIVVNTTRPAAAAVPDTATALIEDLVAAGVARRHALGGLDVARHTNRIRAADGSENRNLFALGQLTAGTHYYTSSMLIIGRQARVVADQLLRHC
ncbi:MULTISPECIES: FAD/NAD(P)-binding protein [unclassified Nonomuraea]|uniref:FAD/NAD(P)-binding protein n=1 Tax=unclassified Nonomuraea TaxID=2593643 RepID=UPI0033D52019